jgi:hypothetical protein
MFEMTRTVLRQRIKTAASVKAGDAVAFPSMGLPDPLLVAPKAVAFAAEDEIEEVIFPVDVAIGGEPAFEGKYPPGEAGRDRFAMTVESEAEDCASNEAISEGEGEGWGEILEDGAGVGLAAADLIPKPNSMLVIHVSRRLLERIPIRSLSKSKTVYTFFKKTSPSNQVFGPNDWCPTMLLAQFLPVLSGFPT